ncbi:DUF1987 domain-containing protein [Candidatus Kapabacteria bacterium]|nr:DUF1987 domain-containing protein [Candidatus Kapabacteria bacterium]
MENLIFEGSKTKPFINFNSETGNLLIGGESYPENAIEFYKEIQEWLVSYLSQNKEKQIVFNFKMVYFNTSSSKAILDILDILEKHHVKGGKINVLWQYEQDDEDIQESGEEFADGLTIPYEIVSYED